MLTRRRLLASAALLPSPLRAETREFIYKQTPQGELRIHVFYPPAWKAEDRRPGLVFFFGGGFRTGSPRQFFSKAGYLADRGMLAASAEYRVRNRHNTDPDASIEDAASAIRWLRAEAGSLGLDPRRLAAGGGSAGGTCALLAGIPEGAGALVLYNPAVLSRPEWVAKVLPPDASEERRQRIARLMNPEPLAKRGRPPMVMFFGSEDPLLAPARDFRRLVLEQGGHCELYLAAGQGHGFFNDGRQPAGWHEATLRKTDEFLASLGYLSGPPAVRLPEGFRGALATEPRCHAGWPNRARFS